MEIVQCATGVKLCESVIATNKLLINEDLREGAHATALMHQLKRVIVVNSDHVVRKIKGSEQTKRTAAPGTTRQNSDLNPWGR